MLKNDEGSKQISEKSYGEWFTESILLTYLVGLPLGAFGGAIVGGVIGTVLRDATPEVICFGAFFGMFIGAFIGNTIWWFNNRKVKVEIPSSERKQK